MRVNQLVARCAQAAERGLDGMRGVFDELRHELDALSTALEFVSGTGGNARQVFYRSPELTLLKVSFLNGRRTPPHDHGTWAMILVLDGEEKNTLYKPDEEGRLRHSGERLLGPGDVLPMRADVAHVAECMGNRPALGLHAYGGDLLSLPRRLWHPHTLQAEAMTPDTYEEFAQLASAADAAPLP